MAELCDLQIHINGLQTFFLNERIISKFSGKIRKIIKQEKRRTQIKNSGIRIDDFPGGPSGFEFVSRFCYNNGTTVITVSNVCLLHCCALFLKMTEKVRACNLLHQTQTFLEEMVSWSRSDILTCLKNCESFISYADSSGLVEKLLNTLVTKISQNFDIFICTSSSSSSPEASTTATPEVLGIRSSSSRKYWWFDDLTILPPAIIEKFIKILGADDDTSLVLTRFTLNYLKTIAQSKHGLMIKTYSKSEYSRLADTAVYGVLSIGKSSFSCRGLFWVLRLVSKFGLSSECRTGLERLIASVLDEATLDDLLVSANDGNGVYDVNLVVRLIRLFVHTYSKEEYVQKMKKLGWLVDKYLVEIAPDHNLKISKFLGVAESLADSSRDCFDGVYRAVDIYLESHPSLSLEERSRVCRCLRYEKLSLEACKELAKNPRIPPRVSVEALAAQSRRSTSYIITNSPALSPTISSIKDEDDDQSYKYYYNQTMMINQNRGGGPVIIHEEDDRRIDVSQENEGLRLNLQKMQWRVMELEKACKKMKGQISRRNGSISQPQYKPFPRLC